MICLIYTPSLQLTLVFPLSNTLGLGGIKFDLFLDGQEYVGWLDLGLTYTVALTIMLLYHNRTDYGGGESVAFGSSVPLVCERKPQQRFYS